MAVQGKIEIQGVSFAYPARPDVEVLRNLTLRVEAGQTVALVGASGSGKSTVVQLLQRFYDPVAGRIRVDGTDIRELSLEWYRNQVRAPARAAVANHPGSGAHAVPGSAWSLV